MSEKTVVSFVCVVSAFEESVLEARVDASNDFRDSVVGSGDLRMLDMNLEVI